MEKIILTRTTEEGKNVPCEYESMLLNKMKLGEIYNLKFLGDLRSGVYLGVDGSLPKTGGWNIDHIWLQFFSRIPNSSDIEVDKIRMSNITIEGMDVSLKDKTKIYGRNEYSENGSEFSLESKIKYIGFDSLLRDNNL